MTLVPVAAMVPASTSESMSASIMPTFISWGRVFKSFVKVVVFPEPGEDIRFTRKVPCSFSSLRKASASLSLSANTLCFTSITRYGSMRNSLLV